MFAGSTWARGLCAVPLLIFAGVPAVAVADHERIVLDPTVVEARRLMNERTATDADARAELNRVPGGTALVTEHEIRESRAFNLKDALDFVPGVLVRPRFGAEESQLSIRGSGLRNNFHLRGVSVLLDGFLYGNADGFTDFESLELLATERIEVYKGANALRLGVNSLGGGINFVTRTGHRAAPLELRSTGGSFGYHKHYLGSGLTSGPWDGYVALTDTELDGFRDYSEQTRRRAYATGGYQTENGTTFRLDLNYARNEENLPGSLTREEFERDPTQADPENVAQRAARDYDYVRGAFTLRTPVADEHAIEWATQVNLQDLFHPLAFAVLTGDTWSWSTELRWISVAPLFGHDNRFTMGIQYQGTRQQDVRYENEGGEDGALTRDTINNATNVAAYAEETFDVSDRLSLIVGGRFLWADRSVDDDLLDDGDSSDDTDFLAFSPRVGFVAHASDTIDVYGNASRAYEPPLLLELTSPGRLDGDLDDLDAQEAWQFEVGTRGILEDRFRWDVSVYDIELRDEIRNVNVQPFPGAPFTLPRFQNIERSRHTGVEAGFDVVVARGFATDPSAHDADTLRWRTAYTWSHFRFVDDREFGDNQLPGAPEHFIRSELRWDHPVGFWIAPGMEAVPSGYAVDSANTEETDAYALADVRMGYTHAPWNLELFFEARNLADTNYISSVQVDSGTGRFFEPGDGRAFYGGVGWRWR